MELYQAILIGLVYYFGNSSFNASLGLYTTSRPLVLGLIVGLIMGDLGTGIEMGIKIQLIYMGFMSTGGSQPSDPVIAGLAGTAFAIVFYPTQGAAALDAGLAVAVAAGAIGNLIRIGRMTWNTIFVQPAKKAIAAGDMKGMFLWHIIVPQSIVFLVTAVPLTLFLMSLGDSTVVNFFNQIVTLTSKPLTVIGALLPTVGIAITLMAIGKKHTIPFFFVGFVLSQYLKLDIIAITVLAIMTAYLIYFGFNTDSKKPVVTSTKDF